MERRRDVVRHLQNVFGRVRDPKVPDPLEVAEESRAVMDGWVFILIDTGTGDLAVDIANVVRGEDRGGIDAEAGLGVAVSIGYPEKGEEKTRQETPEETGKNNVVIKFFFLPQGFVDIVAVLLQIRGDAGPVTDAAAGVIGFIVGHKRDALGAGRESAGVIGRRELVRRRTIADGFHCGEHLVPISV